MTDDKVAQLRMPPRWRPSLCAHASEPVLFDAILDLYSAFSADKTINIDDRMPKEIADALAAGSLEARVAHLVRRTRVVYIASHRAAEDAATQLEDTVANQAAEIATLRDLVVTKDARITEIKRELASGRQSESHFAGTAAPPRPEVMLGKNEADTIPRTSDDSQKRPAGIFVGKLHSISDAFHRNGQMLMYGPGFALMLFGIGLFVTVVALDIGANAFRNATGWRVQEVPTIPAIYDTANQNPPATWSKVAENMPTTITLDDDKTRTRRALTEAAVLHWIEGDERFLFTKNATDTNQLVAHACAFRSEKRPPQELVQPSLDPPRPLQALFFACEPIPTRSFLTTTEFVPDAIVKVGEIQPGKKPSVVKDGACPSGYSITNGTCSIVDADGTRRYYAGTIDPNATPLADLVPATQSGTTVRNGDTAAAGRWYHIATLEVESRTVISMPSNDAAKIPRVLPRKAVTNSGREWTNSASFDSQSGNNSSNYDWSKWPAAITNPTAPAEVGSPESPAPR